MSFAALGDTALPGSNFYWNYDAWYYIYGWAPSSGWDAGKWVRGREICGAVGASNATWFAVWSNTQQRMALFDSRANTDHAACLQFAEFAPPGTVIA